MFKILFVEKVREKSNITKKTDNEQRIHMYVEVVSGMNTEQSKHTKTKTSI